MGSTTGWGITEQVVQEQRQDRADRRSAAVSNVVKANSSARDWCLSCGLAVSNPSVHAYWHVKQEERIEMMDRRLRALEADPARDV